MFSTAKKIASNKIKKKVSFATDVKEEQEDKPNFFRQFKKPKYSTMQKTWFRYSHPHEYKGLKDYLDKCAEKGVSIKDFFLEDGRLILSSAMRTINNKHLKFICENIPQSVLYILFTKNTYLIRSFLMGEAGLDKRQITTDEILFCRMERFVLLLKLGIKELIINIMKEREAFIPNTLKEDFAQAIKDYEDYLPDTSQNSLLTFE